MDDVFERVRQDFFDNLQIYVRFLFKTNGICSLTHSLTHSLTSPVLHQPDKVSAETMFGKTADGRTVLSNESETFKTEAIKALRSTIFTDIKNLNKARKVTWNDAQGKTGMSRIK
jgi:hypothetical protein